MLDETARDGDTSPDTPDADILEVFGAAPLVNDEQAAADPAPQGAPDQGDQGLLAERLVALETAVADLAQKAAFLPPKLRGMGERVEALGSSLAHERSRSLLLELCSLDDLVQAGLQARMEGDEEAPARVLGALAASLSALFASQGVEPIDTDGEFDATRHQAVRQLPVDEARFDGAVLEVDRRGFAAGDRVLRFAEVAVGRHDGSDDDSDNDNDNEAA